MDKPTIDRCSRLINPAPARRLSLFLFFISAAIMADAEALTNEQVAEMRKKRTFRKFTFRGVDLDKLLDLSMEVSRL